MSNGNSTFLIIAGVGVALLALLLLLGSGSEPAPVADVIPTTSTTTNTTATSSASMESTYYSTLVVHAGLDRTVGEREQIELSGEGYDPRGLPVTYQWTADGGLGFFEDPQSPAIDQGVAHEVHRPGLIRTDWLRARQARHRTLSPTTSPAPQRHGDLILTELTLPQLIRSPLWP